MATAAIGRPTDTELVIEPTVEELASTLRKEHEACVSSARTTLEHAFRAGDVLLQIRKRLMRERSWTSWLEGQDYLSRTQAYTYMRVAMYRDYLPDGVGINEGEELLAGLPALGSDRGRPRLTDPIKQDAQRMRAEGLGYKQIAKRLGCSPSTVYGWFNESSAKHRRRAAAALRKQKREIAIRDAVKKHGGAIAEAYSMAERMDDVLGQAHREGSDAEARRELARA